MNYMRHHPFTRAIVRCNCIICAIVSNAVGAEAPEKHATALRRSREAEPDMFCGPRCVQFVLEHFGQREDLRPLVQEIQDRDWRRGSTLAALQLALERRGLYTTALRVGARSRVDWPTPVIAHLNPQTATGLGHFVVLLPGGGDGGLRVWCGLAGVQPVSCKQFSGLWSGAVILTSEVPIEAPFAAVVPASSWYRSPDLCICSLTAVLVAAFWRVSSHNAPLFSVIRGRRR